MSSGAIDPYTLIFLFAVLSLAPFMLMIVTSYVKLVVVLSLIRNALGVQAIPPNMVINAMALILSIYVMAPVAIETYDVLKGTEINFKSVEAIGETYTNAKGPIEAFLKKHCGLNEQSFFVNTAHILWPKDKADLLDRDSLLVLIPAFTISELTSAFKIGFLIYLPFIVIDLVVSNILLAMGMMMVSPMTISLPFKLLLFVLVNGWSRLVHGIILTYK